ncbi:MAG TPA: helix-turn-helix domain-containing protein [Conexibacter sp.]|nr:helix-turn-helix domain-containing protein [Conexibacter sp.]
MATKSASKPMQASAHAGAPPVEDGSARVARREAAVRVAEDRQPLRRRLLEALGDAPATPTELHKRLGAARESVSRKLGELSDEGLVTLTEDPDDRRRRVYAITQEGVVQLSVHRSYGARPPAPQPPTDADTVAFLRSAVRSAVRLRRKTNRLQDAAERLELLRAQADELHAPELALDATNELLTTLRQDRRHEQVDELLNGLERIAVGTEHGTPALAMQAFAHREYALGRLPGGRRPRDRARHLETAQTLYAELARTAPDGSAAAWREREAWSIVSHAGHLRERSKFERALLRTLEAMELFRQLEDPYGESRCRFMIGFCWRLMGDFEQAADALQAAYALAAEHSFQRFQADSLMQLGDVRRCQGDAAAARELLGDAIDRANHMGLDVTQAFAQSALGAVCFEQQQIDEAARALLAAERLFKRCDHHEGLALNARRQARVGRAGLERRGEVRALRGLVEEAFARYKALGSPAGLAACEVELVRLQRIEGRSGTQTIKRLRARLEDDDQRPYIFKDPWVPHVVAAFAAEVDHGDDRLRDEARKLVASADQWLGRWRAQLAEQLGTAPAARRRRSRLASVARFEMGGETRRLALPAAHA